MKSNLKRDFLRKSRNEISPPEHQNFDFVNWVINIEFIMYVVPVNAANSG